MNPPSSPPQSNASPNLTPGSLTPNIVGNIPVKAPSGPGATSFNDEAELDKIMQDVGHELKKEDNKQRPKGFFGFKAKPKAEPKLTQPPTLNRPPATSPPAPTTKIETQPGAKPPMPISTDKLKPAKTSSAPVLVITFAVIITAALIATALYAYKK